jgi:periplasmic divalent cation tolerance protein
MSDLSIIYCPIGRREEAMAIGRTLVDERLAGCINILTGMTSIYRWNDAVQEDSEVVLLVKTRTSLVPAVSDRIRQLHRYDCPAILSWELPGVNADFLQWLLDQTTPLPSAQ